MHWNFKSHNNEQVSTELRRDAQNESKNVVVEFSSGRKYEAFS